MLRLFGPLGFFLCRLVAVVGFDPKVSYGSIEGCYINIGWLGEIL